MNADAIKKMYLRALQQQVTIRRYAGEGDTKTDYVALGNAGLYGTNELIGNITQGDLRVVLMADAADWTPAGFIAPLKTTDKVVVGGHEREIIAFSERKALDGTLIAYEIQARG